jgi:hypothetical protein
VLNSSEASRTHVKYRSWGKDVCGYNNSLRIVIYLVVASVCSWNSSSITVSLKRGHFLSSSD